jgi:uncharacterized protein YgbK (DUF1537 family)
LPDAGRVTVGGVQFLERDGRRTPLQETEYAADPAFAYGDARLRVWAEDRSHGYFRAADGIEVPLTALRGDGAQCVADALQELSESGVPSVCVVDAETNADLEIAAAGLSLARAKKIPVVARSAPAFAAIFAGSVAATQQPPPRADRGLLVVCGSWVPTTTAQLRLLVRAHPNALVEVDAVALASIAPDREILRAADAAQASLGKNGIAIVATPREFSPVARDLAAGERIARNLASIVAQIQPFPSVVLAKGGITSAVTARHGLGVRLAQVVGPIAGGVSLWHARATNGEIVPYIVFPGNVGDEESLLRVVDRILAA